MNEAPPNLRYERKFLAPSHSLAEVLSVVRRHPAMFRESYPARVVNSLYLDTPARRDYFEHVNGMPNRIKTRVRWYGSLSGFIEKPTLERKIKRGLVSGKASCPMSPIHVNGCISPRALTDAMCQASMPEVLQQSLRHLEPAVMVRYLRHYYVSGDGRFRLTVDSKLGFNSVHPGTGAMNPVPAFFHPVILELKFDTQHAVDAANISNALPYRIKRCSKYVLGIDNVLPCGHSQGGSTQSGG
jgi:hypothetical protein